MARNDSPDEADVSKVSRRGLLALGAMVGTTGLGLFSGSAAAATHDLTAFRDAFIGNDEDKEGLGSLGWLFFAKDSGTVYYHNGSSWKSLNLGGQLTDTNGDGLLEAPNHDGIDVGTVETDDIHLGADEDGDSKEWRLDTDSSDTARFYTWDSSSSTGTEYLRLNEGAPIEVRNANLAIGGNHLAYAHGNLNPDYGTNGVSLVTDGSGSGNYTFYDKANASELLVINEGGPVEVDNTVLSLAHEQSSEPDAPSSGAKLWVDSNGNLKATFANETTSTIASN